MARLRPKKYENKGFDPADAVEDWINRQPSPTDARDDLLAAATQWQNSIGKIYAYFITRGCTASMYQIKKWMQKYNIKPGTKAQAFNEDHSMYHGLDTAGVLEKFITKMSALAERYLEILNDAIDNGAISEAQLPHLMTTLPRMVSELKQMVNTLKHERSQSTYRELVQAGAARFKELVMTQVDDTPDELWLRDIVEGAMLQLQEDLNAIN